MKRLSVALTYSFFSVFAFNQNVLWHKHRQKFRMKLFLLEMADWGQ
jgi:hypothetical protein